MTDHPDLLETIVQKLADQQPEPSIFICGDFNFALGRNSFKHVLRKYNAAIFPELSNRLSGCPGDRKEPIDYVLVRNGDLQIESCEFDVTLLIKDSGQDAEAPKEVLQMIHKIEVDEYSNSGVSNLESSVKNEPTSDVTDSKGNPTR